MRYLLPIAYSEPTVLLRLLSMNGAKEARPAAEDILDLDVVCSIQQTVTVGRGVAFTDARVLR